MLTPYKNITLNDTFKGFVIYNQSPNGKFIINWFIGQLGKLTSHGIDLHYIMTEDEARYKCFDLNAAGRCKTIQIPGTDKVHFIVEQPTPLLMNARPIRQQILEATDVLLWKHFRAMSVPMSPLMIIKTDCLKINMDHVEQVDEYLQTQTDDRGQLRLEDKAVKLRLFNKELDGSREYKHSPHVPDEWKHLEIYQDTPSEELAQQYYELNRSFAIQAYQGCVKTYFIK